MPVDAFDIRAYSFYLFLFRNHRNIILIRAERYWPEISSVRIHRKNGTCPISKGFPNRDWITTAKSNHAIPVKTRILFPVALGDRIRFIETAVNTIAVETRTTVETSDMDLQTDDTEARTCTE